MTESLNKKQRWEKFQESQDALIKKRKEFIQEQRKKKEEKLKKELTFKPKITKKGQKCKEYGYKYRFKWKEKVNSHIEDERKKKEAKMTKILNNGRKIKLSKKTKEIICKKKKSGLYKNPVVGWGERFEKYSQVKNETHSSLLDHKPKISERTIELTKNRRGKGKVFERLHNYKYVLDESLSEQRENHYSSVAPITPNKVKKRKSGNSVFEMLYENAQDMKRKKIEKEKENQYSHVPQLSRKSIEIVSKKKRRNESLYFKKKKKNWNEPNLSPKKSKKEIDEVFNRVHRRNIRFLHKKEKIKEQKRSEIMEKNKRECSFEPEISKKTKEINQKKKKFDTGVKKPKISEGEKQVINFLRNSKALLSKIEEEKKERKKNGDNNKDISISNEIDPFLEYSDSDSEEEDGNAFLERMKNKFRRESQEEILMDEIKSKNEKVIEIEPDFTEDKSQIIFEKNEELSQEEEGELEENLNLENFVLEDNYLLEKKKELQKANEKIEKYLKKSNTQENNEVFQQNEESSFSSEITENILSNSFNSKMIENIKEDSLISELIPHFVRFLTDQIQEKDSLNEISVTNNLLELCNALLCNDHISLEKYATQIVSGILICLLSEKIGENTSKEHWTIRDKAATLVGKIYDEYGPLVDTLKNNIEKILVNNLLDFNKPLEVHYGALKGIQNLGESIVTKLMLFPINNPTIDVYCQFLSQKPQKLAVEKIFMILKQFEPELRSFKNPKEYINKMDEELEEGDIIFE